MTTEEEKIEEAMALLRRARDLLREASAPRAGKAVDRALKSADGARRHAHLRPYRALRSDLAREGDADERVSTR